MKLYMFSTLFPYKFGWCAQLWVAQAIIGDPLPRGELTIRASIEEVDDHMLGMDSGPDSTRVSADSAHASLRSGQDMLKCLRANKRCV